MTSTTKADDFVSQATGASDKTATLRFKRCTRISLPMTESKKNHRPRRTWVYGFWMKLKYYRQQAEKYNLDWQNHPLGVSFSVLHNLIAATRVHFSGRSVSYRGKMAMILVFAEDDDRRRIKKKEFSTKQIDRIRKELGLPKGTKPRWYEIKGEEYDTNVGLESEDEEFPDGPYENPYLTSEDSYQTLDDELDMIHGTDTTNSHDNVRMPFLSLEQPKGSIKLGDKPSITHLKLLDDTLLNSLLPSIATNLELCAFISSIQSCDTSFTSTSDPSRVVHASR
ncbi:uncharacterized protein FOMMEDRAFT_149664 [Fomitiporia mediterranea MF3/22]|uniref:Uncharacterized protein n=1 Tax=Fomitiporia mediterranea (strain MF3/22) TaxID=694068 RepID=R7SG96_FOMME|nr:uncharacterized protein FOMMEDRAFT_149664 [Fomitiporia mediterranea MF3/22]EJC97455.1 hypothetical protein FOMMEDRAFT_149664 [Fomitiporia mediterranea MF3/22]